MAPMSQSFVIFESATLSEYFLDLFNDRKVKNPRYSRHAFARSLGISSAMLSFVINGTRSISNAMVTNLSETLELGTKEETYLRLLAEHQAAVNDIHREKLAKKMKGYQKRTAPIELSLEQFDPIARWYVLALLEICAVPPIRPKDFKRVSTDLKIKVTEIREALNTLFELGFLRKDPEGQYNRIRAELIVRSFKKRESVNDFHSQVLQKARTSLPDQAPEDRIYTSSFYALSKSRIPQFREELYALLDKFHDTNIAETEPDAVYGCSMAFFKVFSRENS